MVRAIFGLCAHALPEGKDQKGKHPKNNKPADQVGHLLVVPQLHAFSNPH
jgi:hypothetical protein